MSFIVVLLVAQIVFLCVITDAVVPEVVHPGSVYSAVVIGVTDIRQDDPVRELHADKGEVSDWARNVWPILVGVVTVVPIAVFAVVLLTCTLCCVSNRFNDSGQATHHSVEDPSTTPMPPPPPPYQLFAPPAYDSIFSINEKAKDASSSPTG